MKRIVFDITALFELKNSVTGISRTMIHIIENAVTATPTAFMRYLPQERKYVRVENSEFVKLYQSILVKCQLRSKFDEILPSEYNFNSDDVFLLLGEQWMYEGSVKAMNELKTSSGGKVAILVYDLVPFTGPQYYWKGFPPGFIETFIDYFKVGDFFVSISECTSRDTIRIAKDYGFNLEGKMAVLRLGDVFEGLIGNESTLENFDSPYCLYVSTVQPRKNHYLLYYTWLELIDKLGSRSPDLYFVGGIGWDIEPLIHFLNEHPQLKSKIHFANPSSDVELVRLYKNCFLNLYPSFYEGWGLPVAEACSLGKYTISSAASSMPEIAGDLIEYHSPYDPIDLARKIQYYIEHPNDLESKQSRLLANYPRQEWRKTTSDFLSLLRNRFD